MDYNSVLNETVNEWYRKKGKKSFLANNKNDPKTESNFKLNFFHNIDIMPSIYYFFN